LGVAGGQSVQAVAPIPSKYFPGAQYAHMLESADALYLPAAHGVHDEPSCPAPQGVGVGAGVGGEAGVPAEDPPQLVLPAQGVQAVAPGEAEYEFAAQGVQAPKFVVLLNVPAAQDTQFKLSVVPHPTGHAALPPHTP